ncbi:hypothetical protein AAEX28_07485 [Lentisphaerota bacterium WC36G]|nr:hypothetical protein LJT99_10345 [Lentisphaerae bacterium WC36]
MLINLIGKNLSDFAPIMDKYNLQKDIVIDYDNENYKQKMANTSVDNDALVIAHGGDGTLLGAAHLFNNNKILPIRDSRTAPVCAEHTYEKIIENYFKNRLICNEYTKLVGTAFINNEEKKLHGINDIFIHNVNRVAAVRYRVFIDNELYADEIVGDGAGVATILGSTAYYRSITHSTFRVGIGLAFSNSTEITNHLVLNENSVIKLQITRGPAVMVADNISEQVMLKEGDTVEIKKSNNTAKIIGMDAFMCPKCRVLRHPNQYRFLNKSLNKISKKI